MIFKMPGKVWSMRSKFYELRKQSLHPYGALVDGYYCIFTEADEITPAWSTTTTSDDQYNDLVRVMTALVSNGGSLKSVVGGTLDIIHDNRLSSACAEMEYMLRVKYTLEYRCLASECRENIDEFFDGGLTALRRYLMGHDDENNQCWLSGEFYRAARSDKNDELHRRALVLYNARYRLLLYRAAIEQFGDHDSHRWGNLLSDSALAQLGSPYHEMLVIEAANRIGADTSPILDFLTAICYEGGVP